MKVKIKKCSDSLFWYNNLIGEVFTVINEYKECYIVQASDGFSNIIMKSDCLIQKN